MADDDKMKQATAEKTAADKLAAEEAAKKALEAKELERKKSNGRGVLIVTGPEAGRRRAGHVFGKDPVEIDLADLNKGQLDAIEADPLLSVKRK
jgi:hypothetical protein